MEGRLYESSRKEQEAEAAWEVEREILSQTNESAQVRGKSDCLRVAGAVVCFVVVLSGGFYGVDAAWMVLSFSVVCSSGCSTGVPALRLFFLSSFLSIPLRGSMLLPLVKVVVVVGLVSRFRFRL